MMAFVLQNMLRLRYSQTVNFLKANNLHGPTFFQSSVVSETQHSFIIAKHNRFNFLLKRNDTFIFHCFIIKINISFVTTQLTVIIKRGIYTRYFLYSLKLKHLFYKKGEVNSGQGLTKCWSLKYNYILAKHHRTKVHEQETPADFKTMTKIKA